MLCIMARIKKIGSNKNPEFNGKKQSWSDATLLSIADPSYLFIRPKKDFFKETIWGTFFKLFK